MELGYLTIAYPWASVQSYSFRASSVLPVNSQSQMGPATYDRNDTSGTEPKADQRARVSCMNREHRPPCHPHDCTSAPPWSLIHGLMMGCHINSWHGCCARGRPRQPGSELLWSPFEREPAPRGMVGWQPPEATTSHSTAASTLRPCCPRVAQTMPECRRVRQLDHSCTFQSPLMGTFALEPCDGSEFSELYYRHRATTSLALPSLPLQVTGQHVVWGSSHDSLFPLFSSLMGFSADKLLGLLTLFLGICFLENWNWHNGFRLVDYFFSLSRKEEEIWVGNSIIPVIPNADLVLKS